MRRAGDGALDVCGIHGFSRKEGWLWPVSVAGGFDRYRWRGGRGAVTCSGEDKQYDQAQRGDDAGEVLHGDKKSGHGGEEADTDDGRADTERRSWTARRRDGRRGLLG